jgi:hypothetical protein
MWQKYKKIHTDTVWIILVVFFTVYRAPAIKETIATCITAGRLTRK